MIESQVLPILTLRSSLSRTLASYYICANDKALLLNTLLNKHLQ